MLLVKGIIFENLLILKSEIYNLFNKKYIILTDLNRMYIMIKSFENFRLVGEFYIDRYIKQT